MNATRPVVRAIVVTDGRSEHLPAVLAAVGEHEYDTLDVVVVAGETPQIPEELRAQVVDATGAGYREAVDAALALHPDLERDYLWLLHDDSAPMPGSLASLTAAARKRRRAAVVGAAQVRWDDPTRLVGMGATTSRVGARRVALVEEDDVNQGQHDSREDVLSVSLAGALVRREWWHESGGTDDAYRGYGDSLDLCRRAWRSGYDVLVVPGARIRHAQDGLTGMRTRDRRGRASTYAARRTSEWYHACAYAPALAIPLLILWSFLSAPVRAFVRIAQNEPRTAVTDLSVPWRLLGRLGSLPRSRAAVARADAVPASVERPLLATPRDVLHHVRASELGAYDAWRESHAPSDVERAELALAASRRRRGFVITTALALTAAIALHGDWLASVIRGDMLSGPVLGVTDLTFADVWARVASGWDPSGFGAPALDSAFAALLLPLAAIPGGLRMGLGLLLVLAPALAALGGWAATGTVVRSVWVRGAAALTYGLWPLFLVSIDDGRLGAVIAHLMLPWVLFGLVRGSGWHRGEPVGDGEFPRIRQASPSASAGAAVAMAVAVAAAPVLLPALVVAVVIAGGFARGARVRTWAVAVPALVVSGPALVVAAGADSLGWVIRVLGRDAGPVAQFDPLSPWNLLLGRTPDGVSADALESVVGSSVADALGTSLSLAIGAAVVVAALVALVSLRAAWAVRALIALAAAGLASAMVSQHVAVGALDGVGGRTVGGWPGAGSSLLALGLLMAAAAAASGAWRTGERSAALAWRRTGYSVGLGLAAVVLAADAVVLAWPGDDDAQVSASSTTVLPLAIALDQNSDSQQRVLVLDQDEDGVVGYTVLGTDGTVNVLGAAERDDDGVAWRRAGEDVPATPTVLAPAVGTLAGGADGAGEVLASWGIGVVVVAPDNDELLSALTQVADLTPIGASDYGTPYRVQRADGSEASRAWLQEGETFTTVPMNGMTGTAQVDVTDATLVIAEAADEAWQATLDGVPLTRLADEQGRNAWEVSGSGVLEITYEDPTHAWWLWAAAIVCGWVLLASIPLHRSRGKEAA